MCLCGCTMWFPWCVAKAPIFLSIWLTMPSLCIVSKDRGNLTQPSVLNIIVERAISWIIGFFYSVAIPQLENPWRTGCTWPAQVRKAIIRARSVDITWSPNVAFKTFLCWKSQLTTRSPTHPLGIFAVPQLNVRRADHNFFRIVITYPHTEGSVENTINKLSLCSWIMRNCCPSKVFFQSKKKDSHNTLGKRTPNESCEENWGLLQPRDVDIFAKTNVNAVHLS